MVRHGESLYLHLLAVKEGTSNHVRYRRAV